MLTDQVANVAEKGLCYFRGIDLVNIVLLQQTGLSILVFVAGEDSEWPARRSLVPVLV